MEYSYYGESNQRDEKQREQNGFSMWKIRLFFSFVLLLTFFICQFFVFSEKDISTIKNYVQKDYVAQRTYDQVEDYLIKKTKEMTDQFFAGNGMVMFH